jgi:hypothetical protein
MTFRKVASFGVDGVAAISGPPTVCQCNGSTVPPQNAVYGRSTAVGNSLGG